MLERIVIIGSATVLAALVLWLTLLSDPSSPPTIRRSIDEAIDIDRLPAFDPDRAPGRIDGHGRINKYRIRSVNSRGQLVEMFGDTLTPLPNGVTRVTMPGARLHLGPNRVLDIRAHEGTILAPENQIQSGDFVGDVALILFESLPGKPLDLSVGSPDANLHLYLKDARFDLELGQLESDQEVHMTGPRIDFRGAGLDLTYNDLRHRIDRLAIARGQSLQFKPGNPSVDELKVTQPVRTNLDTPSTSSPEPSTDLHQTNPTANSNTAVVTAPEENPTPDASPTPPPDGDLPPPQYYRARFEKNVRIVTQNSIIEADRLEIVFSLGSQDDPIRMFGFNSQRSTKRRTRNVRINTSSLSPIALAQAHHPRVPWILGFSPTEPSVLVELTGLILSQTFQTIGLSEKPESGSLLEPVSPQDLSPEDHASTNPSEDSSEVPVNLSALKNSVSTPFADPEDVIITWDGQLLLEPEESPPIDLSGPDDMLVQLVGRPVRIETQRHEVISAPSVDYLASTGRIRIIGSDTYPLEIRSNTLGVLRGKRLVIDQEQGTGQIIGSGSLRPTIDRVTSTGNESDPESSQIDSSPPALASGVAITWDTRVDLSFYIRDDPSNSRQQLGHLDALKDAIFQGMVHVQHPQFDLKCDQITVNLDDPHDDRQQTVDIIHASGQVFATVNHADPQQAILLRSDLLTIDLTQDSLERTTPSQLIASGQVQASQGSRSMQADRLEINLEKSRDTGVDQPTPTAKANTDATFASMSASALTESGMKTPNQLDPRSDGPLAINADGETSQEMPLKRVEPFAYAWTAFDPNPDLSKSTIEVHEKDSLDEQTQALDPGAYEIKDMIAQGHVVVDLEDLGVHVTQANRIVMNALADQIEIFGSVDIPARIEQSDGSLTAQHIIASPSKHTVHVSGPGTVTLEQTPADRTTNPTADSDPRLTVTWTDAMHFDNHYGLAQFIGNVVSNAWSDQEMSQLMAQDLRLEFAHSTIRAATARDQVMFVSTNWSDTAHNHLETRMRITGPLISFDNTVEQIQVIGPGKMLLEDYRKKSDRRKSDPNAATLFGVERTGQVKFTGRGATLMRWSDQLTLDAFHNDLRADSKVQMIHRSLDSQLTVRLDCQQFVADLEYTGGLGVWFAGKAPQPHIKAVYADLDVRVISDNRTILTDHLEYTGFDQSIILRADPGRLTQIQEEDQPTALTAERFRWDLPRNRLEILKPGPSRVPVR